MAQKQAMQMTESAQMNHALLQRKREKKRKWKAAHADACRSKEQANSERQEMQTALSMAVQKLQSVQAQMILADAIQCCTRAANLSDLKATLRIHLEEHQAQLQDLEAAMLPKPVGPHHTPSSLGGGLQQVVTIDKVLTLMASFVTTLSRPSETVACSTLKV
jgi:ABC-type sugar transport system ATPase subunit